MKASGDSPQVFNGFVQGLGRVGQPCFEFFQIEWRRGLYGMQFEHERDQMLLGSVVQIAFDETAGRVGGGEDRGNSPAARCR